MVNIEDFTKGWELFHFLKEVESLKKTLRFDKTHTSENIIEPAAGHSWKLTLMVPLVAEQYEIPVDIPHSMKLAAVHDLGEYRMNKDFEEYGLSKAMREEKDRLERETMEFIREKYSFGEKVYNLWDEFRIGETYDSKYVNALDKIEGMMHCTFEKCDEMNHEQIKFLIQYGDEKIKRFRELEPLLGVVKNGLKPIVEKRGVEWLDKYNYALLTE